MPRSWYVDRTAWVAAGLLALAAGWHLLRDDEAAKRPTPFNRVVLYTRRGCHLCEEVRATLAAQGERLPPIIEVDIDDDDDAALKQRFSDCVPVVEIDGKIRFRGRVNPVLLRRLITAKSSQRPGTA